MTTPELIFRCNERLNKTSNPSLPTEETLKAIITLSEEKESAIQDCFSKEMEVAKLKNEISVLNEELKKKDKELSTTKENLKEQSWIALEFGDFIRNIANRQHLGKEVAAANRVYDLNKDSISKKMRNAYVFDSKQEAIDEYKKHCIDIGIAFDEINFVNWLFDYCKREY